MTDLKLGMALWTQGATWPEMDAAARRIDTAGYDHLWAWDHLYAILGDPHQPVFEGWSLLAALAMATKRVRLGLFVGANTFRNPGLVAKTATTLDHISNGRAILGVGSGWFEPEHHAAGIAFGTGFGQRLDWADEAVSAMRRLLDGEAVTSAPGAHYAFDDLRHAPLPLQARLPIMIGGAGEKKTLRTVARYADMWNTSGSAAHLERKDGVLREHCAAVGRDEQEIVRTVGCKMVIRDSRAEAERVWAEQMARNLTPREEWNGSDVLWLGTPEEIAAEIRARVDVGFETVIVELPAPYDPETIDRLRSEVKPLVDRS